jgi:transcription elongation factor Elf1
MVLMESVGLGNPSMTNYEGFSKQDPDNIPIGGERFKCPICGPSITKVKESKHYYDVICGNCGWSCYFISKEQSPVE